MQTFEVTIAGTTYSVRVDADGRIEVNGVVQDAVVSSGGGRAVAVHLDGAVHRVVAAREGSGYRVLLGGVEHEVTILSERDLLVRKHARTASGAGVRLEVHAPMPALVTRVEVAPGDEVPAGRALLVLEAMKMENELRAPHAARVKEVLVRGGQAVEKGQLLLLLEEHGPADQPA